uniref:Spermatophylax protein 8 n=1 Tax=Gryllodes sigillatus TaxID=13551 RepID=A0A0N9ZUS8_9ORTH|nr:spermatophylax protein 8 [Gryllodes sigillatus]
MMWFWNIMFCAVGLLIGFNTTAGVDEDQSDVTCNAGNPDEKYEINFENSDKKQKGSAMNSGLYMYFMYVYAPESERLRVTLKHNGELKKYFVYGAKFRRPALNEIPFRWASMELDVVAQNEFGDTVTFSYLFSSNRTSDCDSGPCPSSCSEDDAITLKRETTAALEISYVGRQVSFEDDLEHLLPTNPECGYFFHNVPYKVASDDKDVLWLVYKRILCAEEETIQALMSPLINSGFHESDQ